MVLDSPATKHGNSRQLTDGSRVGVVGGGPAGSFFAYFLLQLAGRAGLEIVVDIYEPRDFEGVGPKSCNMCGGIVSESLVQDLAAEGLLLPPNVVQRGLDSYQLHMDIGDIHIATPKSEKRIAAVHRGCGPRDLKQITVRSFDGFLLEQALNQGARRLRARVIAIGKKDGQLCVTTQDNQQEAYDLIAVAAGINAPAIKLQQEAAPGYAPPKQTKTYICEAHFYGRDMVKRYLGSSMHVFLLGLPHLEIAAIIPKGEYATICLIGKDIDRELVDSFMHAREVKACFPPDWEQPTGYCHCSPRLNVRAAQTPFADGIVFIGDSGATRLYKDGMGAAYRTAKAAAKTAIFHGITKDDFSRYYKPVCDTIAHDNRLGQIVFGVTRIIQRYRFLRRGLCQTVAAEQTRDTRKQRMSAILWNTFTGSASYKDILLHAMDPAFLFRFALHILMANLQPRKDHD